MGGRSTPDMARLFSLKRIGPKMLFQPKKVSQAVEDALDDLAVEAVTLFNKTTATWKNKPKFDVRIIKNGVTISASGKAGKIFSYVDEGTRAHIIRARKAPLLRFKVGGRPKTRPRVITSTQGKAGTVWVGALKVHHPGNEPREFSVVIAERIGKKATRVMQKELNQTVLVAEGRVE